MYGCTTSKEKQETNGRLWTDNGHWQQNDNKVKVMTAIKEILCFSFILLSNSYRFYWRVKLAITKFNDCNVIRGNCRRIRTWLVLRNYNFMYLKWHEELLCVNDGSKYFENILLNVACLTTEIRLLIHNNYCLI